ncbi:MAG: MFS transporter [Roseiflexaceae bacterium]
MYRTEMAEARPKRLPLGILLAAGAISQIGDAMAMVALPWFVLQTTGSAALTGLAGAVTVLPAFLAGIFGGVLVDRLGYRRSSILADVVSGLAIASIPLASQTVGLSFWALLSLIFLGSLLALPHLTAGRSMLPELAALAGVRRERANAAFESLQHLSFLIGPPLAGVLIAVLDAPGVLWIDAATFMVSALLVAVAVPSLRATQAPATWRYREELLAGLRFLRRDRLLMAIAASLAITNFLGNTLFTVVLPVYTTMVSGRATDLGLMVAAEGAGALIGIALYGAIGHRLQRRLVWIAGYLAFALMLWVITLTPPVPVVIAVLFVSGIVGGPLNPLSVTVRQERIPPELRGRVFSTFSAIAMVSSPFGIALAGLLTEQRGLPFTLLALASCYTIVSVGMLFVPALRELDARS